MNTMYDITESNLYKAIKNGRKLIFKKNQVLQSTDYKESLFLIESGYIKRYKLNNNGTESIQGIYGPDHILPVTWMLNVLLNMEIYSGPEVFYYESMTDTVVHTISKEQFKNLEKSDSELYKTIAYIAGRRLETYIYNFENVSLQNAEKRLAHQLVYHAKKFGIKTDKGIKIPVPLKQKDLASLIDVTRETASVNLKALRDKKLIKNGSLIVIENLDALENFAYS